MTWEPSFDPVLPPVTHCTRQEVQAIVAERGRIGCVVSELVKECKAWTGNGGCVVSGSGIDNAGAVRDGPSNDAVQLGVAVLGLNGEGAALTHADELVVGYPVPRQWVDAVFPSAKAGLGDCTVVFVIGRVRSCACCLGLIRPHVDSGVGSGAGDSEVDNSERTEYWNPVLTGTLQQWLTDHFAPATVCVVSTAMPADIVVKLERQLFPPLPPLILPTAQRVDPLETEPAVGAQVYSSP